jgi:hypothetical protein
VGYRLRKDMHNLNDISKIPPSEQVGRDTFSRYRDQAKAAGLASLEILENGDIDKVYCEWHDDFVVRKNLSGKHKYTFFQVKTNHRRAYQWSINDIFGFFKKTPDEKISKNFKKSYAGKLLAHTIQFGDACEEVVFLSNTYLKDETAIFHAAIVASDTSHELYSKLIDSFKEVFSDPEKSIDDVLAGKLVKKFSYNEGADFLKINSDVIEALTLKYIFKFSEIELNYNEANQIIHSLFLLVEKKSSGIISIDGLTEDNVDE